MVVKGPRQGSHLARSPGSGHNGTDLQARHAAEHGRGVSQVYPLGQQVAAIGEIQERLPLLARMALTAGARHTCLSTPAAPSTDEPAGAAAGAARRHPRASAGQGAELRRERAADWLPACWSEATTVIGPSAPPPSHRGSLPIGCTPRMSGPLPEATLIGGPNGQLESGPTLPSSPRLAAPG